LAHFDESDYQEVLKTLQSGSMLNPIVFFWDEDSQGAVLGPQRPSPVDDPQLFFPTLLIFNAD